MSKARNIADLGSNDVLDTHTNGVTVSGDLTVADSYPDFKIQDTDGSDQFILMQQVGGASMFKFQSGTNDGELYFTGGRTGVNKMKIATNGDIIMYKDDGTTAGMTFDASAGSVDVNGGVSSGGLTVNTGGVALIKTATDDNVRISQQTHASIQAVNDAANAFTELKVDGSTLLLNTQSLGTLLIGTTVAPTSGKIAVNTGISTSSALGIEIQQATNGANKAAAGIGIAIGNGGESTNAADLFFQTASGGSLSERMRVNSSAVNIINSAGISINTDGASNHAYQANVDLHYHGTAGSHEDGIRYFDKRGFQNAAVVNSLVNDGVNTGAANLYFKTASGGALATRMVISPEGNVNINDDFNVTTTGNIRQEKNTSGSIQDQITNVAFVHPDGNSSYRGCKVNIAYSTIQLGTSPLWLSVLTPQAYSNWNAGGSATFKLTWSGYHASGTSMAKWDAVFGNNHGGSFRWKRSAITILEASDSYYSYTPNVEFYRQTGDGNGFTGSDTRMRVLWIKISGNAGSNVCPRRFLEIDGMVGHPDWAYEVNNFGYTAPVNISAIGASV